MAKTSGKSDVFVVAVGKGRSVRRKRTKCPPPPGLRVRSAPSWPGPAANESCRGDDEDTEVDDHDHDEWGGMVA